MVYKTMKSAALCILLPLWMALASGPAKVGSSTVHYTSGKDTVNAEIFIPEGKGPFPGIIVIHEWLGLEGWTKAQANELAGRGYVTLAVDLYRGKVASSPEMAHELMRGLPEDRAVRDLMAAAEYLKTRPEVNPKKLGSIGWCMGGGYSLEAALNIPDLAACVICYGRLVTDSSSIVKIHCPILGLFGQDDQGITPESVREFGAAVKKAGKDISVTIYPGAGHRFMNDTDKGSYRDSAAKNAWSKIHAFFERTLGR